MVVYVDRVLCPGVSNQNNVTTVSSLHETTAWLACSPYKS